MMKKHELNDVLYRMLGSEDLVSRWWHSPNKFWDGSTPYDVWRGDPQVVERYIMGFALGGDYS
jgi:hypothetical protein